MAKLTKQLAGLQEHLDGGEDVLHVVEGAYEAKIMGQDTVRNGILAATDQRLVFYAKKLTGFDFESFPYGNISSIEAGKNMMGRQIKFFASGNEVHVKWIKDAKTLEALVAHIRSNMGNGGRSAPAGESSLDKLKKLAELRDAGVVSDEEFEEKKARLLEDV